MENSHMPRFSILAVDCGTSRVLAGRFNRDAARRLTLVWSRVEWLPRRDRTEEGWLAETASALVALARHRSLTGACVVGLPAHLTVSRLVAIPVVAARQVRKITGFEMRQGVPLPPGEVRWAQATIAASAAGREIMLSAARRATIESLVTRLGTAGLHPVAVLPAWQALWQNLADHETGAAGILGISIGARSVQLICRGPGGSSLRTLALGGDTITERIAAELGLDFTQAEALKLAAGTGGLAETRERAAVEDAAGEFARRLGGEIARSLAGLDPEKGGRPDHLWLAGGGAGLAGLGDRLAEQLHLPVRRHDPRACLPAGSRGAEEQEAFPPALLGDLAGLAAAHRGRVAVNLLPPTLRWSIGLGRRRSALMAAAVILAAGMGGAIGHERLAANTARERVIQAGDAIDQLRRIDRRNRDNLARLAEIREQTAALQRLAGAKRGWTGFLADLQERLATAGDAWLERLQVVFPPRAERAGAAATGGTRPGAGPADSGARPAPVRISLGGCLLDPGNPLGPAGPGAFDRARALLGQIRASPFVAAVENERFDAGQSGVLRLEVTLVVAPGKLL